MAPSPNIQSKKGKSSHQSRDTESPVCVSGLFQPPMQSKELQYLNYLLAQDEPQKFERRKKWIDARLLALAADIKIKTLLLQQQADCSEEYGSFICLEELGQLNTIIAAEAHEFHLMDEVSYYISCLQLPGFKLFKKYLLQSGAQEVVNPVHIYQLYWPITEAVGRGIADIISFCGGHQGYMRPLVHEYFRCCNIMQKAVTAAICNSLPELPGQTSELSQLLSPR